MRSRLKALNNIHIPSGKPDVYIFASARSGSTLMHELILTQPGFKPCKVPFDLRYEPIANHLARGGIHSWADLYTVTAGAETEPFTQTAVPLNARAGFYRLVWTP